MLQAFLHHLGHYLLEILPSLAVGFLLSGIIHEFIPAGLVERHLGKGKILPLLYATIAGTFLPICCVGSLPVALSLHRKGAGIGPVVAFLIATPATSATALLVTYSLLGLQFTIYIFVAVIFMGIIMGLLADLLGFTVKSDAKPTCCCAGKDDSCSRTDPVCGMEVSENSELTLDYEGTTIFFCSPRCRARFSQSPEEYISGSETGECEDGSCEIHSERSTSGKLISALRFAFWDMPRDIGVELIIGLILAAAIASFDPVGGFISRNLGGAGAYPLSLVFGILMYVCSTASVPLVDALINSGMNVGAGMVLLIVGPVTSWGTILVIRSQFGGRMLTFYLIGLSALSVAFGLGYTLL